MPWQPAECDATAGAGVTETQWCDFGNLDADGRPHQFVYRVVETSGDLPAEALGAFEPGTNTAYTVVGPVRQCGSDDIEPMCVLDAGGEVVADVDVNYSTNPPLVTLRGTSTPRPLAAGERLADCTQTSTPTWPICFLANGAGAPLPGVATLDVGSATVTYATAAGVALAATDVALATCESRQVCAHVQRTAADPAYVTGPPNETILQYVGVGGQFVYTDLDGSSLAGAVVTVLPCCNVELDKVFTPAVPVCIDGAQWWTYNEVTVDNATGLCIATVTHWTDGLVDVIVQPVGVVTSGYCPVVCVPTIESFDGAGTNTTPFNSWAIVKPSCCTVQVTTDAGTVTVPAGVGSYSPERFDCALTTITASIVAGTCTPQDITIITQHTGKAN